MGNAYCYVTNATDYPIAVLAFNRADVVYRRYKALHIIKPGKRRKVEALPHPEGIKIAVVYSVNARKIFWYKRWVVDNGIEVSVDSVTGSEVKISGDVLVNRYTAGHISADDFADFSEVVALLVPGPQPQDYIPSSSPPHATPHFSHQHATPQHDYHHEQQQQQQQQQQHGYAVEGHHASRRRSSHGSRKSFSHAEAKAEAEAEEGHTMRDSFSRASYSSSSLPPPPAVTANGAVVAFSRRRSSFSSSPPHDAELHHANTQRHSLDSHVPTPHGPPSYYDSGYTQYQGGEDAVLSTPPPPPAEAHKRRRSSGSKRR